MREPSWWYGSGPGWQAALLAPVSRLYGVIAERRYVRSNPIKATRPVICVGNFTAGGTGKTPMSLFLASIVKEAGREPWFLSRGYGGSETGPVRVDPAIHTASDIGDEPLLLARTAPTVVARHRRDGAAFIASMASPSAVIIMDDGLQNPAITKDFSIAIVDGRRGFGNGNVIPAGPLRAPLAFQARLADCVVVIGKNAARHPPSLATFLATTRCPVMAAETVPSGDTEWLRDRPVIAYAGIANPQRFFAMLERLGARIVSRHVFADHEPYSQTTAAALLTDSQTRNALLVTTEKDLARLQGSSGHMAELCKQSKTLPITLTFDEPDFTLLKRLVNASLANSG